MGGKAGTGVPVPFAPSFPRVPSSILLSCADTCVPSLLIRRQGHSSSPIRANADTAARLLGGFGLYPSRSSQQPLKHIRMRLRLLPVLLSAPKIGMPDPLSFRLVGKQRCARKEEGTRLQQVNVLSDGHVPPHAIIAHCPRPRTKQVARTCDSRSAAFHSRFTPHPQAWHGEIRRASAQRRPNQKPRTLGSRSALLDLFSPQRTRL